MAYQSPSQTNTAQQGVSTCQEGEGLDSSSGTPRPVFTAYITMATS